jgi:Spy/CpxP family protein refolding chaperone
MKVRTAFRLSIALMTLVAQAALAQDHDLTGNHHLSMSPPSPSPYAGMEKRDIKALSEQQVAELKTGLGMGLALAAELNGYPGPLHTLQLADALQLSDQQRTQIAALITAMKFETIPIGQEIIAEEAELDHLFAARQVTQASLDAATSRIAAAQGRLRSAHLRYHLTMVTVLSREQIQRYAELRGYSDNVQHNSGEHESR